MATFNSQVKIPKATEHFSVFNLSCDHVTTQDFFKIKPVYSRVLVPGQSINVQMSHISRLAPLAKPFYGSVYMTNRAFFVPFRTVMEGFNEFITDTPYVTNDGSSSIISSVPTVKMSVICNFLMQPQFSTTVSPGSVKDFTVEQTSGSGTVSSDYKYTALGRYAVDVLNCLGYQVDWSSKKDEASTANITLSALPLLAFVKIYTDYLENTNFSPYSPLQGLFKGANKSLSLSDLTSVFQHALYASYENDYLTSSWSNPQSPYNPVQSTISIVDSTVSRDSNFIEGVVQNSTIYNNTVLRSNGTKPNLITQYILNALNSLTDYMRRHQISGYRAIDRFRSRFGITLPDAKLNRSVYLGKSESVIDVTDVTSTADTANAVLGQYSGFGISRDGSSGNFSYKTDEYGIFVILSIISPLHAQYANGLDRHLLDIGRLDLYTPEFDGLGCQAIAECELKSDFNRTNLTNKPLNVWAYTPRYAHYKCSRDILSGDFKVPSKSTSMKNFHLFRMFDGVPSHNVAFCTGKTSDYTRVFNDTSIDSDHFFTAFHFQVKSDAPMSALFENYHFDESGAPIEQKVGGTRLS